MAYLNLGFPGSSAGKKKKNHLQCRKPCFDSRVGKFPWRRNRLPTPVPLGFPGGSDSKESACYVGDLGLIPELGRSPGGGHGNPLQYSCLENPHGLRSLASYSPWGRKESAMTEWLSTAQHSTYLNLIKSIITLNMKNQATIKRQRLDFPGGPVVKKPPANAGNMSLIPGPGRSHMPGSN